jgi:hypothetical protein
MGDSSGEAVVGERAFGVWRLAFGVWRLAFGVWRLAFGVRRSAFGVSGDCPATGLIFAKPKNSSEAARVALPQTAVAIVWRRSARLAFPGRSQDTCPPFANHAKATAINGLSLLIPLGQDLWTGARLTFGGSDVVLIGKGNPLFVSHYVGQASSRLYRPAFSAQRSRRSRVFRSTSKLVRAYARHRRDD